MYVCSCVIPLLNSDLICSLAISFPSIPTVIELASGGMNNPGKSSTILRRFIVADPVFLIVIVAVTV
ncbi:MAG: Uncharacterised protein [Methanobacteriota archaeon]|nr:MAG: Uncharacterised protein [Euryarchaeota archaeon]